MTREGASEGEYRSRKDVIKANEKMVMKVTFICVFWLYWISLWVTIALEYKFVLKYIYNAYFCNVLHTDHRVEIVI